MSDSDRGDGTAHLGGFGILLAILLSAILVGGLAYTEGYQGEARQNRAYEYQEAAKRNALIACSDSEPSAVADCVYDEINSARDQAEGEQDLDAQQWMARWAGILTILTGATTVISWFALRYLRATFVKTAEAAAAAVGATKAMLNANEIGREQIALAKASERAHVLLEFDNVNIDDWLSGRWNRIRCDLRLRNAGRTPCTIVRCTAMLDTPCTADIDAFLTNRWENYDVLPRHIDGGPVTFGKSSLASGEQTDWVTISGGFPMINVNGEHPYRTKFARLVLYTSGMIWVTGRIIYSDVLGDMRNVKYAATVTTSPSPVERAWRVEIRHQAEESQGS